MSFSFQVQVIKKCHGNESCFYAKRVWERRLNLWVSGPKGRINCKTLPPTLVLMLSTVPSPCLGEDSDLARKQHVLVMCFCNLER